MPAKQPWRRSRPHGGRSVRIPVPFSPVENLEETDRCAFRRRRGGRGTGLASSLTKTGDRFGRAARHSSRWSLA